MQLEEAIKHWREKVDNLWDEADDHIELIEGAKEYEQLVEWLEELKERREKEEKRRHTCSSCIQFIKSDIVHDYGRCDLKDSEGSCTRLARARGCKHYQKKEKK